MNNVKNIEKIAKNKNKGCEQYIKKNIEKNRLMSKLLSDNKEYKITRYQIFL